MNAYPSEDRMSQLIYATRCPNIGSPANSFGHVALIIGTEKLNCKKTEKNGKTMKESAGEKCGPLARAPHPTLIKD